MESSIDDRTAAAARRCTRECLIKLGTGGCKGIEMGRVWITCTITCRF